MPYFKDVVIETTEKLVPLFSNSFKNLTIQPIALDGENAGMQTEFDYDCYCWMGDLPNLMGFYKWETARPPYLHADKSLTDSWKSKLRPLAGSRKIIALTWRSIKMDMIELFITLNYITGYR